MKSLEYRVVPLEARVLEMAQARLDALTKPRGSLGRLEEFARRLVAIYGGEPPPADKCKKAIFVFAGDHGVAESGVSAFPKEVTRQMVFNFLAGGAAINVLARHVGAEVAVVDVGVDYDFGEPEGLTCMKVVSGTGNILNGPAMGRAEAQRCIDVGLRLAEDYKKRGYRMFGTGDMGIANTTPSSAIAAVLAGRPVDEVTGRGTGIDDAALRAKADVIKRAIEINAPDPADPLGVLAKVGGAEIGAIAGLCLGGAVHRVPVVVDGFISTAGALIACSIEPGVVEYLFSAHRSAEKGHGAMLEKMGLKPVLDLGMRLGEGTGAALAMAVIEAGLRIYGEMATFGEAGVSKGDV